MGRGGGAAQDADGLAVDRAIHAYGAGRSREADDACRAVLARSPHDVGAANLLAILACDRGDPAAALDGLAATLAEGRATAAVLNTAARAWTALGRLDDAEAAYRRAWSGSDGSAVVANNLGCLLRRRGRTDEAVGWFEAARRQLPGSAEVARNLAEALASRHDYRAALDLFAEAIALDPANASGYAQYGAVLLALGRAGEAADMLRAAVRHDPADTASLSNLGLALRAQGRNADAAACFRDAVRRDPGLADAHYNLGCLHALAGETDAARACHDRALAVAPLHGPALWGRCMVELPVLYDTEASVAVQRARYADQLAILERRSAEPDAARALAAAAGASQPFFLPYQGRCDRALQARYGAVMARVLYTPAAPPAAPRAPGERVRLGIVSGFFQEHTVWRLMLKGWLRHIDRRGFEVAAFHTGAGEDGQTALARQLCPCFVSGPAQAVRGAILDYRPHALLYPEIGMDRVAARLGAERLAPLQCVSWGQPDTTGLPTMDVFLSSALMEPDGAADHYTERLVRLPGLGICYEADERQAARCTRAEFGLRETATVFWCGQALFKYLPGDDDLFPRIAAAVGDCQFLFFGFAEDPAITRRFAARLARCFARHGLDAARHLRVVDPVAQGRFLGTVRLADIVLDSVGWSGGKSTLDILAEAPAIVAHAGPLMRGRHTAAILRAVGTAGTVADTRDAYCAIAIRLAQDPGWRNRVRQDTAAGRARILGDLAPIRALEAVLAGEPGRGRPTVC